MSDRINLFIPAAGYGKRLAPITSFIPKPLVPILGVPAIGSVLERISSLPIEKIGVNLHHKGEQIEEWIASSSYAGKITRFREKQILGTGGALKNAKSFLSGATFMVHNSDVISRINLTGLLKHHRSSCNLATLAVHDYPEFNNLYLDNEGYLLGLKQSQGVKSTCLAFTGIALYEPQFLKFLPEGVSHVVDTWLKCIKKDYKIGTFHTGDCFWSDIGTPDHYASTLFHLLKERGERIYIHKTVERCDHAITDGHVVIERNVSIGKKTSLRNCILLPNSTTKEQSSYENGIIGPDFFISLHSPGNVLLQKTAISSGGSEREFYRTTTEGDQQVIMECKEDDQDFVRHIAYTRFFLKHSIPVPELLWISESKNRAAFEDLGDLSLYYWLKCKRDDKSVTEMYRKVLDALILIHTIPISKTSKHKMLGERIFDYDHLRWETTYFEERFLKQFKRLSKKKREPLTSEFEHLALRVDTFKKTLIHRDFQSQNIMIKNNKPNIIDIQGARIGPPAYDLVSLIWDPYSPLGESLRTALVDYYVDSMSKNENIHFDKNEFKKTLLPCRLQRHMQALGAYVFLSTVKKKSYFAKHIPEGLRLLKDAVVQTEEEYPALFKLVSGLRVKASPI